MRLILPSGESIELTEEFIDKIFPREILGIRESNLNYFQVIFNRFSNEKFSSENISLQFIAFIIHQINKMHDAWVRGDRKVHYFIGEKDIRNLQKLVLVACREYFSSKTVIAPSETILCDYLGIKIHYYGRPPNELSFDSCLPANLHFIIDKQLLGSSFAQESKIFSEIESKLEKIGAFCFSFKSSETGRFCISGITVPEMNLQLIERGFDVVGPYQEILNLLVLNGICDESLKNKIRVSDSLNIIGKTSLEFSKEIPFFEIENYAVKLSGAGLNCEAYEGILENGVRITLTIDALISWFQNRPFGSQEKEENSPSIPIFEEKQENSRPISNPEFHTSPAAAQRAGSRNGLRLGNPSLRAQPQQAEASLQPHGIAEKQGGFKPGPLAVSNKKGEADQWILNQFVLSGVFDEILKEKIRISRSLDIIGITSIKFSNEISFREIENYAIKLRKLGLDCEAQEYTGLDNGIKIRLTTDALVSWLQKKPLCPLSKEENLPAKVIFKEKQESPRSRSSPLSKFFIPPKKTPEESRKDERFGKILNTLCCLGCLNLVKVQSKLKISDSHAILGETLIEPIDWRRVDGAEFVVISEELKDLGLPAKLHIDRRNSRISISLTVDQLEDWLNKKTSAVLEVCGFMTAEPQQMLESKHELDVSPAAAQQTGSANGSRPGGPNLLAQPQQAIAPPRPHGIAEAQDGLRSGHF